MRSGIPAEEIDDVVLAESLAGGGAIARYAAVAVGLDSVPGVALNRHCAGGLSAVQVAAASIRSGMDRVVVAGGTQSTSLAPKTLRRKPGTTDETEQWHSPSHPFVPDAPDLDMSITVGWNAAFKAGLTRRELDAWALRSHQRAVAGIEAGAFKQEVFPFDVVLGEGRSVVFETDEHPRRDCTAERLAALKPLHPEIDGFSITAGNAAGLNDGAAAVVVAAPDFTRVNGLETLAVVRAWASVGVPPAETGLAPAPAIRKVLDRAGLTTDDIALWEINEAFASVPLAACRELNLDEGTVNVLGSGCSLGHPVAATGTRMILTLVHELRRRGGGLAVAAMCAGGGMGSAIVLEVPTAS